MSEGAAGLLVFLAICVICSIAAHFLVRTFWLATVLTPIAAVPLFQLAAYLHIGFLDPFWPVAVVTTSFVSLVASVVIGAVIRKVRRVSLSQ